MCSFNFATSSTVSRFVILVSMFSLGMSIRCWVCRSDSDPKCGDPFDNRTLPITDCDIVTLNHLKMEPMFPGERPRQRRATMCRKIRQKVEGNWRILRGCAFLGEPGEGTGNEHHCLIRQGTHDIYMEYCTCDSKDGCNSSTSLKINTLIIIPLIAILTYSWIKT